VLAFKRSSGAIHGGASADLVVLKRQLQVRLTLVGGSLAYRRES
jgi:N-acetylglucosamine-6-phosphate deacetylase